MTEKQDDWDISQTGVDLPMISVVPPADNISSVFIAAEQSPAAVALATLAGSLIYLNRRGRQLFNVELSSDLSGHNIADFVASANHRNLIDEVVRDGRERQIDMRLQQPGAAPLDVVCRAARVDGIGNIASWLAFSALEVGDRDTGLHREVGDDVRQQAVNKLAGIASWEMQVDTDRDWVKNPVHWDSGVYAMLNVKPESVPASSSSFLDFVVPEDREQLIAGVRDHLQHETPLEIVFRIQPRGGLPKLLLARGTTMGDKAAGATRRCVGITQDITSILGARPRLLEMEAVLEAVAENIEGPVYAVDSKFRYTYFNQFFRRAMQQLYGVETTLGERAFHAVQPDARRSEVLSHLRRAFDGQRIVEVIPIAWQDSIVQHFELTYAPIVERKVTRGVAVVGIKVAGKQGAGA